MAKRSEKPNPDQPTPEAVVRVPMVELPAGEFPSHPRDLTLSLSPPRRRQLMAIYRGLQAAGARVMVGRGGEPVEIPVSKLADVCYYLLDQAKPFSEASGKTG